MSSSHSITIQQSATFTQEFILTDRNSNVLDVSDYTGKSQIRKDYNSNTVFDLTVTLTPGLLTLSMPAANTAKIKPGKYLYDVLLTSGNTVYRVIDGMVTVTPDITK